jgi:hypothetical protein
MGMEDYAVRLIPAYPDVPKINAVLETLQQLNFEQLKPSEREYGAMLSHPVEDEWYFVRHTASRIVEAQIKLAATPSSPCLHYISVRFAVCQPPQATEEFLGIVCQLALRHEMNIRVGHHEYSVPQIKTLFSKDAQQQIQVQKEQWQRLFEGDTEELPISVNDAWNHFLSKHQHLLATR